MSHGKSSEHFLIILPFEIHNKENLHIKKGSPDNDKTYAFFLLYFASDEKVLDK